MFFRGRDIHTKEWWVGSLLEFDNGERAIVTSALGGLEPGLPLTVAAHPVDPKTVGMASGYTDVDGNEVFEGDIVTEIGDGKKGVVRFGRYRNVYQMWETELGFYIDWVEDSDKDFVRCDFLYWVALGVRIVDNIHEEN